MSAPERSRGTPAGEFPRAVPRTHPFRFQHWERERISSEPWWRERMPMIARTVGAAAGAALMMVSMAAVAQQFPAGKPVEMTVMFGAGSAADVTARHLADGMTKVLGVPVPVVNRTGGGGAIGYSHVQQQRADGYSIIWNSNSISTTYHSGALPFDYKAFEAVARVSVETPVIAVRADSPWKTLKELVDYAKENPGKVRIGNSGTGSHTHFSASALFAI